MLMRCMCSQQTKRHDIGLYLCILRRLGEFVYPRPERVVTYYKVPLPIGYPDNYLITASSPFSSVLD